MKNTVADIKILLDGLNSRLEMTEDRVSELEKVSTEIIQNKTQRDFKSKKCKTAHPRVVAEHL